MNNNHNHYDIMVPFHYYMYNCCYGDCFHVHPGGAVMDSLFLLWYRLWHCTISPTPRPLPRPRPLILLLPLAVSLTSDSLSLPAPTTSGPATVRASMGLVECTGEPRDVGSSSSSSSCSNDTVYMIVYKLQLL